MKLHFPKINGKLLASPLRQKAERDLIKSQFSRYKRKGVRLLALEKWGHLLKQQTWDFQKELEERRGRGVGLKTRAIGLIVVT